MVSKNGSPTDLAAFRLRRAEAKEQRRRQKARDNFLAASSDYGREIPPRLNPDVPDMIDQVRTCYVDLTQWINDFREKIVALLEAGKLHPQQGTGLLEPYGDVQAAVDAATADILRWQLLPGVHGYIADLSRFFDSVHRIGDHAKYVYAVGSRDIAKLQYRLAEMAGTSRLDREEHANLQWQHCLPMWETLYHGTISAVRDDRTWDGAWGWYDNTYSDGRQVIIQARVKHWFQLDCNWPCNEFFAATARSRNFRGARSAKSLRFTPRRRIPPCTTRRFRSTSMSCWHNSTRRPFIPPPFMDSPSSMDNKQVLGSTSEMPTTRCIARVSF